MKNNYLFPSILKFSSFDDLLKLSEDKNYWLRFNQQKPLSFDEVLSHQKAFVIAEPGYGKTRLLKEIVRESKKSGKKTIFIDLKNFNPNGNKLAEYLKEKSKNCSIVEDSQDEKIFSLATSLTVKGFDLKNSENISVCLDALDEVSREDFSRVVDAIKDFFKTYSKISLFISCRLCHFKEYKNLFYDFKSDYLMIKEFSYEQVIYYLKNEGFFENQIKELNHSIERRHDVRIIEIPRYLEMILALANKKGADYVAKLSLAKIFEECINFKLRIEGKKVNLKKEEMIKRILSKIALLMEMQQINQLSKKDLITIFDDVKSNLTISFLHQVSLEYFLERSILKNNIDNIEFENTEFQEYFAAQEILRLGDPKQIIFDVAVDPQLKEFSPSWFNTLSYLVEIDISILPVLLEFGSSRRSKIQDKNYHRLITQVKPDRLDLDIRKKIFEEVFNYYQKALIWIPYEVERGLACYFDPSQKDILKKSVCSKEKGSNDFYLKGNVATILEYLIENESLDRKQLEYWREKLIEFVNETNTNGVLQRNALGALGKFKDIGLLKRVESVRGSGDELICQSFLGACMDANPNDPFSIESFVEGCKDENIYGRYGMYKVKERSGIKCLLNYFIEDTDFFDVFMDNESIFRDEDENKLIANIEEVFDSGIKKQLHEIIVKGFSRILWHRAQKSSFIKQIVRLLSAKDKKYTFSLIKSLKNNVELEQSIFYLDNIFAICLQKEQVAEFVQIVQKMFPERKFALDVLHKINQSQRSDSKGIYEEGRKYLNKDYEESEVLLKAQKKKMSQEQRNYLEFQKKLKVAEKGIDLSVLRFYENHREKIKDLITNDEKGIFKKIIKIFVFEKMNLCAEANSGAGKRRCSDVAWERYLGSCLVVAQDFKFNVDKYRQKIISYMLCDIEYHYLQAIFEIFPQISAEEICKLLDRFSHREKGEWEQYSLILTAEKYQEKRFIPFLKKIVFDDNISMHLRDAALKAVVVIECDEKYFKEVFSQYNKVEKSFSLAKLANKILIEKFENQEAIQWIFELLEKAEVPSKEFGRINSVSGGKVKSYDEEFSKLLMRLNRPKYKKDFLKLLDISFDLPKKNVQHVEYGSYLREIVAQYFDNLKQTRSYEHLYELEKYVQNRDVTDLGVNWFLAKINDLKQSYMVYFGQQQNMAEGIKKYNRFKEAQYLDIATPRDLFEKVKDVIDTDVRKFVEDGFYDVVERYSQTGEKLIQKNLTIQIENSLLKRGIRGVDIHREIELLDGKKIDYLVSYGLIGKVLIEIKLTGNNEVFYPKGREEYKPKFLQYVSAMNATHGIFLIFQIKKEKLLQKCLPEVKKLYIDCPNIEVMGLNCLNSD